MKYWRMLLRWLRDHEPVVCGCCTHVFFAQDARYEQSNTGQRVCLCPECHKALFNPFTGDDR